MLHRSQKFKYNVMRSDIVDLIYWFTGKHVARLDKLFLSDQALMVWAVSFDWRPVDERRTPLLVV